MRQSFLYAGLTALVLGMVWLFWGKEIQKRYGAFKAQSPAVARAEKSLKQTEKAVEKSATAEWQKAQSGATGLLSVQAAANRRDFQYLADRNEARWRELLRRDKSSPAKAPEPPPAKPRAKS